MRRECSAVERAIRLVTKGHTPRIAAERTGVNRSTIYRAMKRRGIQPKGKQ